MITLNNRGCDWKEGMTIQSIMDEHHFTFPKINVYLNGVYIPKEAYESTLVKDGDNVNALHLMAGG